MLLLLDNFDSFTYNLVQAFEGLGIKVKVLRPRSVEEVHNFDPKYLVIGPGPGHPSQAHISKACIEAFAGQIPILGVCLGHQAIGEVFGGVVVRADLPMHGKISPIYHNSEGIFRGLPQGFAGARYHSLVLKPSSILQVTAWTQEGEVMGVRHPTLPIQGLQFHPESIATPEGAQLLKNFLIK